MNCNELIEIISKGEDSSHQFKEKIKSIDLLAVEISAFANSEGGILIAGVSDKGDLAGLDTEEIRKLNQWISNATSSKIDPPLFVRTEILLCEGKRILIIYTPRGLYKPYAVNKAEFWVKNGADKRRATREELFRLMQSFRNIFADELETDASMADFDYDYFERYYKNYYEEEVAISGVNVEKLLKNLKLAGERNLTLAGLLVFGKYPEQRIPYFSIKATYFDGSDVSVEYFRDKQEIRGKLAEQFTEGVSFIKRNLHRVQKDNEFNAPGELEIPESAFAEAVSNAIIHRDYFISAPIFIHLFTERLELISPGTLPNTLTEENIRFGVHVERNPTLLSMLEKDRKFRYSGRGSGIPRIIRVCRETGVDVRFVNDISEHRFKVVFGRNHIR
ncbi:RNA-binding domain-containing protein [Desulfonema magnum]|uniref:Schlafen and ATP-dependent DNA helicase domains-containing protein n=1 Tax=Desulfonema magnum TaxID=45655 RepID=A0A975BJB5_9BACT|nr:RNA-binding domain-containing protein [Desulfonema magnum]QTA86420.1 Schlafen and ATP-dependent DNA helicase domains-containing protein [Desulfonema magnum]